MRTTKVQIAAGLLLSALLAAGAGSFAHRTEAADPERIKEQAVIPAETRREQQPRKPPVRFLSLAEARAIALENGTEALRVLADVGSKSKGIILTGIARDQNRAEFERKVNQMLLNVENAYWNLNGSYWQLHSREQGLRFAYEAWKIVRDKYREGKASRADFAQSEGQYNLFRSQRMDALDVVMANERQLRSMLHLQIEDGTRLVPSDAPTLVEKQPDWDKAHAETMENRPELRLARQDIKLAKENSREMHRAQLVLQDQELKAERYLGLWYRRMSSAYFQLKAARVQRLAFAEQLRTRFDGYREGKKDASLDLLLEAQRFWADALATEFQGITTYNNALCGWEYAKGSILDFAHIRLVEKLPADDEEVRAVDFERKQTQKEVHRKDAKTVERYLDESETQEGGTHELPAMAPSLASLRKTWPSLGEVEKAPTIQEPRPKR